MTARRPWPENKAILRSWQMTRTELTEKILDIKREKDWNWAYICGEIGGMGDPRYGTSFNIRSSAVLNPNRAAAFFASGFTSFI